MKLFFVFVLDETCYSTQDPEIDILVAAPLFIAAPLIKNEEWTDQNTGVSTLIDK